MRTIRNERYWPEVGAIFMANKSTREECFERKLFGLPYNFADFVMEVKLGMVLFLYDFEEKNLYGVFEAASDGAMNIIPDAYKSTSHLKFPAQVRFTTLWHCDPVPEHTFRDAIKENYYNRSKFNFGLSKAQVRRLLKLFENRKIKIPSSPVVEEGREQKSPRIKSVVATHSCPLEIADYIKESINELQESVLGKQELIQDSIQDSIPDEIEQSDDYIPLPSIEPDEIEEFSDVFQWAEMSFTEVGECLMKPLISPEFHVEQCDSESSKGPTSSPDPKETDDFSGTEVQKGMYSDISMTRTSAFLRLSGVGKVVVEETHSHCDSKVEDVRDILEGLEMRRKMWDKKRKSENHSKSEVSVFSRLGRYKEGQERDENERFCGGFESMYDEERSGSRSYKRQNYEYDQFSRYEESNRSRYDSEKYKNLRYCPHVSDFSDT